MDELSSKSALCFDVACEFDGGEFEILLLMSLDAGTRGCINTPFMIRHVGLIIADLRRILHRLHSAKTDMFRAIQR